jgi:hypothetical protein
MRQIQQSQPLVIRVMPSRRWPRVGVACGIGLALLAVALRGVTPPTASIALFGIGALLAVAAAARMIAQLPIIEVTELGIALWLQGPYRRPFFAPWGRVRSIGLVRIASQRSARALSIEFVEDGAFRVPQPPAGAHAPVRGADPVTLSWPSDAIDGTATTWVRRMSAMRGAELETDPHLST